MQLAGCSHWHRLSGEEIARSSSELRTPAKSRPSHTTPQLADCKCLRCTGRSASARSSSGSRSFCKPQPWSFQKPRDTPPGRGCCTDSNIPRRTSIWETLPAEAELHDCSPSYIALEYCSSKWRCPPAEGSL